MNNLCNAYEWNPAGVLLSSALLASGTALLAYGLNSKLSSKIKSVVSNLVTSNTAKPVDPQKPISKTVSEHKNRRIIATLFLGSMLMLGGAVTAHKTIQASQRPFQPLVPDTLVPNTLQSTTPAQALTERSPESTSLIPSEASTSLVSNPEDNSALSLSTDNTLPCWQEADFLEQWMKDSGEFFKTEQRNKDEALWEQCQGVPLANLYGGHTAVKLLKAIGIEKGNIACTTTVRYYVTCAVGLTQEDLEKTEKVHRSSLKESRREPCLGGRMLEVRLNPTLEENVDDYTINHLNRMAGFAIRDSGECLAAAQRLGVLPIPEAVPQLSAGTP